MSSSKVEILFWDGIDPAEGMYPGLHPQTERVYGESKE